MNETEIDPKEMKEIYPNKLKARHLNIDYIRNKFEFSENVTNRNLDNILLSKKNLMIRLIQQNFFYRFDMNCKGGGTFILYSYIRNSSNLDPTVTMNPFVLT